MKIELSSYNSEQDEEANNKLTIEDDSSKMNNEKNIQINELHNHSIILTPQEQFKNFPNYRFFTKFGIRTKQVTTTHTVIIHIRNSQSRMLTAQAHKAILRQCNLTITQLPSQFHGAYSLCLFGSYSYAP